MRVLVVGRTGQVARALAEAAAAAELSDIAFLGRDALDLAAPGAAGPAIAGAAPDLVINAAAYTAVDRAEAEPALARRINAEAVGEIAEAAERAGAALLHLSTDYVFAGTLDRPHREDDLTGPINVYGESKLAGEHAAIAANPRTAVIRTSWVYAPWGRNFVTTMLRLADRETLRVVDDQRGGPSSALEIARLCLAMGPALAAGQAGAPVFGVTHLCGHGSVRWAGFAAAVFEAAMARELIHRAPTVEPIPTADYPTPAARPLNSRLDCRRLSETFGLSPAPWEHSLAEVITRLAGAR